MPASSASVSMERSSSDRVASSRTPSSISCSRRLSGLIRTRAGVEEDMCPMLLNSRQQCY